MMQVCRYPPIYTGDFPSFNSNSNRFNCVCVWFSKILVIVLSSAANIDGHDSSSSTLVRWTIIYVRVCVCVCQSNVFRRWQSNGRIHIYIISFTDRTFSHYRTMCLSKVLVTVCNNGTSTLCFFPRSLHIIGKL